jgi:hypothetical protein
MLVPDYTGQIIGLLWIIGTIYVAIVWMFRLRTYRNDLRLASQRALEDPLAGLVDPYRGSLPPTRPWAPSLGVRVALLGLLLVPCLWGAVVTFAIMFGIAWDSEISAGSTCIGWALPVVSVVAAWFCRRARKSFRDLERNVGRNWRISAGGALLTGALFACLLGMTKSIEKVGRVSMACSYAVAGESVLLGLLLLYTSAEVAAAEKNVVRPRG